MKEDPAYLKSSTILRITKPNNQTDRKTRKMLRFRSNHSKKVNSSPSTLQGHTRALQKLTGTIFQVQK